MSESPDGPGVIVTLRDMYNEIVGLRRDVHSLVEERVDTVKTLDDHELRLRSIERWRYGVPLATLVAIGSTVAALWPR